MVGAWDNGELVGGALFRSLRLPFANVAMTECLDGPIFLRWERQWAKPFIEGIAELADEFNSLAVFLKGCPDLEVHRDIADCADGMHLKTKLQPGETRAIVELNGCTLEGVASRFDQNLKRNIKRAQNSGLFVRQVSDVNGFKQGYSAWMATAERKGFGDTRPWPMLEPIIRKTTEKGLGCVLASFKDNEMLGAIFLTHCGQMAEYQYGGFFDGTEELRPNHILHYEAIRMAFERNMRGYNLGTLLQPNSPGAHGVDRFKLAFRPTVHQAAPTIVWERKPRLYKTYQWLKRRHMGRRLERQFKRWLRRS